MRTRVSMRATVLVVLGVWLGPALGGDLGLDGRGLFSPSVVAAAPRAGAANQKVLDRMVLLNRRALSAFQAGKHAVARKHLLDALAFGRRSGLGEHNLTARTYVHLGVVYISGFEDRRKGLDYFGLAVRIRPNIQVTPALATPRLVRALDEARRGGTAAAEPVAEAAPKAESAPSRGKADPVALAEAELELAQAEAQARGGSGDLADEEGAGEGELSDEDMAALDEDEDASLQETADNWELDVTFIHRRPRRSVWMGMGIGSGYGLHLTRNLDHNAARAIGPGFAFGGLLTFTPELGFQYDRRLSLAIQSRHQLIPQSGTPDPTVMGAPRKSAHALFARAYYLMWEDGNGQIMGTATVGGGSGFRLKISPNPTGMLPSSDTISGGPIVVGPGAAFFYNFSKQLIGTIETKMLLGFWNVAAVLDLTAGAQYAF
jgi:hypothetical protein